MDEKFKRQIITMIDNGFKSVLKLVEKILNKPEKEYPTAPDVQKVEVINQPQEKEIEFPEVQKVEVTNFSEQKAPIVNVKAPEINIPEFPTEFDVKKPKWFSFDPITKKFDDILTFFKSSVLKVEVTNQKNEVVIVDKKGNPVDLTQREVNFKGYSEVGILDHKDARIDPASESTLQQVKTAIEAISGGVVYDTMTPTEGSTTDTFVYSLNGVTVQTKTLTYSDSTKSNIPIVTIT